MKIIKTYLNTIQKELENSFEDPTYDNSIKIFVTNGSKLIRSSLAILYLKAQDKEITSEIIKILVAGELIHNASLLHDDVLDNAETRRNKKTLSKKFNSKISILAGDYLLSHAVSILLEISSKEVLKLFQNCTKEMTNAEIKQYFLRKQLPSETEYINICKGKTAKLFSTILESCAIISKLNQTNAKIFGEIFGVIFQIKNDLAPDSRKQDKNNKIFTAEDIMGIEKTNSLLDNYKEELRAVLNNFSNNEYSKRLKDLIELL